MVQTITLILLGQLANKPVPFEVTKGAMLSIAKRVGGGAARVRVVNGVDTRSLNLELPPEFLADLQAKRNQKRLDAVRNPQLKPPIRKFSSRDIESLAQSIAAALPEAKSFAKWERVTRMPTSPSGYQGVVAYYPVVAGRSTNGNGGVISMAFDVDLGVVTQVFIRKSPEIVVFPSTDILKRQSEKLQSKTKGEVGVAYYGYSTLSNKCEAMLRVRYSDNSFEIYDVKSLALQFPRATTKSKNMNATALITSKLVSLK